MTDPTHPEKNRGLTNTVRTLNSRDILAVVYDCDGVLVDSREANAAYYTHILAQFNMPPVSTDQLHMIQMLSASRVIDFLFEGTALTVEARAFERSITDGRFLELTRREPHVVDALTILRKDRKTSVVSNRGKSLRPLLAFHGIGDLFDVIVGSNDVEHEKPDPESLGIVMSRLSLRADQMLYIGDSEIDELLCRQAGVTFVSYKNQALDALLNINDHLDIPRFLSRNESLPTARERGRG